MKNQKNNNKKDNLFFFAKFSGLFFEMVCIIGVGVFFGSKLDENTSFETPFFTIILSLLGVFISLYLVFKQLKI